MTEKKPSELDENASKMPSSTSDLSKKSTYGLIRITGQETDEELEQLAEQLMKGLGLKEPSAE